MSHAGDGLVAVIFVGEARGGVTGSESFWQGAYTPVLASSASVGFVDVPNWQGAHDRTWCIRPRTDEHGPSAPRFIESSFRTKVEFEASLLLPPEERELAERNAAVRWA